MNNLKNLLITLASLLAALVIIGGAVYIYQKESAKTHQADQLISSVQDQFRQRNAEEQRRADLAQAQASLQVASARLAELRASFSPVAAIDDAYKAISKDTAALAAAPKVAGPAGAKIDAAEKGLADVLQAWKILLSTIPTSGANAFQIAQAERYAEQAQGFIDQINTIVSSLTTSDSGLTQKQVDSYKATTDTAAANADKTSGDLAIALPSVPAPTDTGSTQGGTSVPPAGNTGSDSGSGTTGSNTTSDQMGGNSPSAPSNDQGGSAPLTYLSPTAGEIAVQQQLVNDLQNQVSQLQNEASSTPLAPPGTLDAPPPPMQFDIYGRPKLIQGSNTDVFHQ